MKVIKGRHKGVKLDRPPKYKKKPNGKNAVGCPSIPVPSLARVTELAKTMCTDNEMASRLGLSRQSFYNMKQANPEIQEAIDVGRDSVCFSLRASQISAALKGDKTMQVWLGKQYLGQKDRIEHEGPLQAERPIINILISGDVKRMEAQEKAIASDILDDKAQGPLIEASKIVKH